MVAPRTPPPGDDERSREPAIEPGVREFCRLVARILRRREGDGATTERSEPLPQDDDA